MILLGKDKVEMYTQEAKAGACGLADLVLAELLAAADIAGVPLVPAAQ